MKNVYNELIQGLQIDPGPQGLNIPDLDITATDDEVLEALQKLDEARQLLGQKRALLRKNADRLIDIILSSGGTKPVRSASSHSPQPPPLHRATVDVTQ